MSSALLNSADVKAKAHSLGFSHVGFAPAEPVPEEVVARYEQWLREGRQGDMAYMEKHVTLRRDPRLLLSGAKTVVSLAMSYHPGGSPTQPALAWYAQGRDYHDVIRERLKQLMERCFPQTHPQPLPCREGGSYNDSPCSSESIYSPSCKGGAGGGSTSYRICVDTAPIFEKYWAWRCGLGWIGRHTQLVIPHEGSAFFLAELLLTAEADHYDNPIAQFSILNSQSSILNSQSSIPLNPQFSILNSQSSSMWFLPSLHRGLPYRRYLRRRHGCTTLSFVPHHRAPEAVARQCGTLSPRVLLRL